MAYININTAITRNRKFKRLKRYLNKDDASVLGYLTSLWTNVLDLAEDGDITKWSKDDIAEYSCYPDDPQRLYEALTLPEASWFDFPDGRTLIHDWWEYAGKYLTTKYRTSNTLRLFYIKDLYKTDSRQTKDGLQTDKIDKINKIDNNTEVENLLKVFMALKGYHTLTHWGKHKLEAAELLKLCEGYDNAKTCLEWVANHLTSKNLEWTLSTVVGKFPDWQKTRPSPEALEYEKKYGKKDA